MNELVTSLQQKYQDQEILILGWGKEGQSTYHFLRQIFPKKTLWVTDEKRIDLSHIPDELLQFKDDYVQQLTQFQVIFKAPGVPGQLPELQHFTGIITSQMNEFLAVYSSQVIGVTGTKGKSTTSSLIYHLLHSAQQPVLLAGNIGQPVFESVQQITPETTVVVEMSSYQLEQVKHSPHIAVLLNLFPEHLNYHQSFEKYSEAKANITKHQTAADFFVFDETIPQLVAIAQTSKAVKRAFSPGEARLLEQYPELEEAVEQLPPIVRDYNIPPAITVAQICHLSKSQIMQGLRTFQTLPHRLETVGTFKDITFIDDTLATIPEAACLAIDTYPKTSVIILGGFDRGIDYSAIVDKVMKTHISTVLFFSPSGDKMAELMKSKYAAEQLPQIFFVQDMEEAVRLAYQHAKPHSTVLLSPASPSHGQFKNYEDKSAQYVHYIHELAKEHSLTH